MTSLGEVRLMWCEPCSEDEGADVWHLQIDYSNRSLDLGQESLASCGRPFATPGAALDAGVRWADDRGLRLGLVALPVSITRKEVAS